MFDRTLLRAGETVSMKHLLRTETSQGFARAAHSARYAGHHPHGQWPAVHTTRGVAPDGHAAARVQLNTFAIPVAAKLGNVPGGVTLKSADERERQFSSGEFRVEEFRLPVLEGRITPQERQALVQRARPCPPSCRSTTSRAAARPTCRCACRPWCAASPCSVQRLTKPSASSRRAPTAAAPGGEERRGRGHGFARTSA